MRHTVEHFPSPPAPAPRLSEQPTIHPTARVLASQLGSWTEVGPSSHIEESVLDDYSYTSDSVSLIYTTVGKFCSIAAHVRINPGNHPVERVTQHHCTYRRAQYGFGPDDADFFAWRRAAHCTIGHDVWLGHAAVVLPGVHIGTGAVVGAGAVVTRDVAPYTIVAGVPARPIRQRFAPEISAALLAIAWWDWDRATLQARFADLLDISTFLAKYGGEQRPLSPQ